MQAYTLTIAELARSFWDKKFTNPIFHSDKALRKLIRYEKFKANLAWADFIALRDALKILVSRSRLTLKYAFETLYRCFRYAVRAVHKGRKILVIRGNRIKVAQDQEATLETYRQLSQGFSVLLNGNKLN